MTHALSRRAFLSRTALLGCSLAASPLLTPISLAATSGDNRLVVILLRGGMDGLDVVRPYGDPAYAALRGDAGLGGADGAIDLDGYYAMHPALRPLAPMWGRGQLGFAHAVSTPYRDKRSHFDGQDILEAGLGGMDANAPRDGWLNRVLQHLPDAHAQIAYAIGRDQMHILTGPAPTQRWSPEADLVLSPQAIKLARLIMKEDPEFDAAFTQAMAISDGDGDAVAMSGSQPDMMSMMNQTNKKAGKGSAERSIAEFTAKRLREETRIASFSINGWDTHQRQDKGLEQALTRLADTVVTLERTLTGPVWSKTTVVAVTEFGRTARMNGAGGSDHGTGGLMLLAGGALRGGRVMGDFPGLAEAQLYERRDLMPTRDLRAYLGWLLHDQFGLPASTIEASIFPGLDMGASPTLLR